MGLEAATHVTQLVSTNPTSTDARSEGDDHLRLIKLALLNSFPKDLRGISSPVNGQVLRYDGTSFKNRPKWVSAFDISGGPSLPITAGTVNLGSEANMTLVTDTDIGDNLGLLSGGNLVIPLGNPNYRILLDVSQPVPSPSASCYHRIRAINNTHNTNVWYHWILTRKTDEIFTPGGVLFNQQIILVPFSNLQNTQQAADVITLSASAAVASGSTSRALEINKVYVFQLD